jgi:alanine-glyoxylate transaminase/serine-glyoxylate transaminase/serine-pyruvate transaminase
MTEPLLGHLDPDFLRIMDSCREKLRAVLRTANRVTLATPGTGTSGMEAAVMNAVQPGDDVVVGVCGYFGGRIAEMAERAGGRVTRVEAPWGAPVDPEAVRRAIRERRARVVAIVHAETSTGVLQPVEPIAAAAREAGALTIVDCVTSLGGVPVETDRWGADIVYSATQKCLSAPPGAAPITVSDEAWQRISSREVPPNSWYLDLRLLEAYWDERRTYHHTAPISMVYALHEALSLVLEEGLEARWARHERNGRALQAGLEAMGLTLHAQPGYRLPVLTTVKVPEGIDEAAIRKGLLERYSIEVGGGLGELRGRVWRVGLMGEASTPGNVLYFLSAFGRLLREAGFRADIRAAREAAAAALAG